MFLLSSILIILIFYYNITITLFLFKNLLLIEKNINKISTDFCLETEQFSDCKLLLLLDYLYAKFLINIKNESKYQSIPRIH